MAHTISVDGEEHEIQVLIGTLEATAKIVIAATSFLEPEKLAKAETGAARLRFLGKFLAQALPTEDEDEVV